MENKNLSNFFKVIKGGAGSGNFGHSGRPGKRGGSSDSVSDNTMMKNPSSPAAYRDYLKKQNPSGIHGARTTALYDTRDNTLYAASSNMTHTELGIHAANDWEHGRDLEDKSIHLKFDIDRQGDISNVTYHHRQTGKWNADEEEAVDRIYNNMDRLVAWGLPKETHVSIQLQRNDIETTLKHLMESEIK